MKFLGHNYYADFSNKIKFSKFALDLQFLDIEDFFEELLPSSKSLWRYIEKHAEEHPPLVELCLDIFYALYKYSPELREFNSMDSRYYKNYAALKALMESEKYKELRAMTVHDELCSLIATEILADVALEVLSEINIKTEALQQEIEDLKEFLKKNDKGEKLSIEEARKALEENKELLQNMYKQNIERKIVNKLNLAYSELLKAKKSMDDWSLGHDQSYQHMTYENKINLINDLKKNEKLKRVALLAGRLRDLVLKGKQIKSKRTALLPTGIEIGNNLSKVLPSQLVKLSLPQTVKSFYKDYNEKKLLQRKIEGKHKLGLGPIVAMIDSSGSMAGSAEIYSKAVCLTLLDLARKQKRAFLAIHFDSGQSPENLHVNRFSKKSLYDIKEVIDLAEYFGGGGTEFEPPLRRAMQEIDKEGDFSKADMILITDGSAPITEKFIEELNNWKKKKKVTLFSIMADPSYGTTESIKDFSDKIVHMEDVSKEGANTANALFKHLLQ